MNQVLQGDALTVLREMPDQSVHCVVTSPPYWNLRDYLIAGQLGLEPVLDCLGWATGERCGKCYLCRMVKVFREVRRVLRKDGTCWVNIGDTYSSGGRTSRDGDAKLPARDMGTRAPTPKGLKAKDLCLVPWRLALALQADGWTLRQEIIWSKPNPMPGSQKDRCTTGHEYIWLLSRSSRYFCDMEAIREPAAAFNLHDLTGQGYAVPGQSPNNGNRPKVQHPSALSFGRTVNEPDRPGQTRSQHRPERQRVPGGWNTAHRTEDLQGRFDDREKERPVTSPFTRNRRSVWTIPPEPFPGAHFATFPQKLVEPCIKAGTSEAGQCPTCGTPWVRIVNREFVLQPDVSEERGVRKEGQTDESNGWAGSPRGTTATNTTGWKLPCKCPMAKPVPAVVLDPFGGSGTVAVVAERLGRDWLLIELSPEYAAMAEHRIYGAGPMLAAGLGT